FACVSSFFFFTLRPAPSSTLFPYTTLFRSALDAFGIDRVRVVEDDRLLGERRQVRHHVGARAVEPEVLRGRRFEAHHDDVPAGGDRKSTRLNSSHVSISYAVFCLKKKKYTQ